MYYLSMCIGFQDYPQFIFDLVQISCFLGLHNIIITKIKLKNKIRFLWFCKHKDISKYFNIFLGILGI